MLDDQVMVAPIFEQHAAAVGPAALCNLEFLHLAVKLCRCFCREVMLLAEVGDCGGVASISAFFILCHCVKPPCVIQWRCNCSGLFTLHLALFRGGLRAPPPVLGTRAVFYLLFSVFCHRVNNDTFYFLWIRHIGVFNIPESCGTADRNVTVA